MICEMKDILKTMVDNNEPHWSADTMDMVRVELHHVYTKAAKADEYEAKAKAWDKLMFEIDEINDEATVKELPSKIIRAAKITALSMVIKEYESGESE